MASIDVRLAATILEPSMWTPATPHPRGSAGPGWLGRFWMGINQIFAAPRRVDSLLQLSDHLLADVGLSRADFEDEALVCHNRQPDLPGVAAVARKTRATAASIVS